MNWLYSLLALVLTYALVTLSMVGLVSGVGGLKFAALYEWLFGVGYYTKKPGSDLAPDLLLRVLIHFIGVALGGIMGWFVR